MDFDLSKVPHHQTYNLLIGLVAPRPIAWITSIDPDGNLNAAPFSAYNYVGTDPPIVAHRRRQPPRARHHRQGHRAKHPRTGASSSSTSSTKPSPKR